MKADLHLHSRFSKRAPEWLFRKLGIPDSATDPGALYQQLQSRGMDLITLTDHDTLDGCLSIAERPGVFLSEQVTATFPDDRSTAQILVWGLSESQHCDIQKLRENIYDLQSYLASEQLAHGVAHPLYSSQGPVSSAHFEKLLLLFRHFESVNGLRDDLLGEVLTFTLTRLTLAKIEELANRHRLSPTHTEPWRKCCFGGSDDHGSLFPAKAFTEVPDAQDIPSFLSKLHAGHCLPHGLGGNPLTFSHSLYNNLRIFLGSKFALASESSLVGKGLSRFIAGRDPTEFSWGEKIGFLAQSLASGSIFDLARPAHMSLLKQLAEYFGRQDLKTLLAQSTELEPLPERRAFRTANFFANQLAFYFFKRVLHQTSTGGVVEALQEASLILPILAALGPYLYAFQTQASDRRRLRDFCSQLTGEYAPRLRNNRRAWFTDTLEDVNGVAKTIRKLTAACVQAGHNMVVITSRSALHVRDIPIRNFPPIGEFELPEYELQKLSFPPVLEMVDEIQREGFTELIISTPGPVGLTALLAAKILGLRTTGIYHTDFPQYVRILTEDSSLETLTWEYMKWFYGQLDIVYVNSESYRHAWVQRGIPPDKFRILPRGLDTALFHPNQRTPDFWLQRGAQKDRPVILYVGRVSKEKNFDVLLAAWAKLSLAGAVLAIVGDGPYLAELRLLLPHAIFTGYLAGKELAAAYASADIFVFPSTTDTYGNVVVEALASGLPCIVSDLGGPRDLIVHGKTGLVTRAFDSLAFAEATIQLISNPTLRARMSEAAHLSVQNRAWADAANAFWNSSPE
jgi:glycosyltransferase involved in cell wall biosynthesis